MSDIAWGGVLCPRGVPQLARSGKAATSIRVVRGREFRVMANSAPIVTRRTIVLGALAYPLASCTSVSTCETMADPRQRHQCRNQVAFEERVAVITIAALVGAAAGYGIARSVKANPVGGALIGAFVAGGTAAAFQYSNYLMQKANNDRLLALDLLNGAIRDDIEWHRRTYVDLNRQVDTSLAELKVVGRSRSDTLSLGEKAKKARAIVQKIKSIDMDSSKFVEAARIYPPVITLVSDRRTDQAIAPKVAACRAGATTLENEGLQQQRRTSASIEALYKMGYF